MVVFVEENGKYKKKELEQVGNYGLFGNPIVNYHGVECVCDWCSFQENENGIEKIGSLCQSGGCDFCDGHADGCRGNAPDDAFAAWCI